MRKYRGWLKKYLKLISPIWYSKNKKDIRKWTAYIIAIIILQILLAVIVTSWTAGIFNALELHSISGVIKQIIMLIGIFVGSIFVNSTHLKVKRNLHISLRTWMTELVLEKWMKHGTILKLAQNTSDKNDNPDGRIAEDIRVTSDMFIDLINGIIYHVLLLGSFVAVLWGLSGTIVVGGVTIYGYLVWLAFLYAGIASIFGYVASKPLTATTNDMCSAEQDFRFQLVNAKENCGKIVLKHEEDAELTKLKGFLENLKQNYDKQTGAWAKIVAFQSGYGVVSMAVPILAAAPHFIAEKITLGGLMQSAQSFSQVVNALSWGVNAMPGIAIWRTSVERLLNLIDSIDALA